MLQFSLLSLLYSSIPYYIVPYQYGCIRLSQIFYSLLNRWHSTFYKEKCKELYETLSDRAEKLQLDLAAENKRRCQLLANCTATRIVWVSAKQTKQEFSDAVCLRLPLQSETIQPRAVHVHACCGELNTINHSLIYIVGFYPTPARAPLF